MHSSLPPRRSPRALGSLLGLSLVAVAAARATDPSIQVQSVPGAVAQATAIGKPSPSQVLHFAFALPPSNRAAFKAYADAVNNRKSKDYRNFLTPAQIGAKFGPSDATINTVTAYLKGKGFTIRLVNGSKLSILADATVKQSEAAFSTTFKTYKANAAAKNLRPQFYANSTILKLPQSIGGKLRTIGGVTNAYVPKPRILTASQTRTLYDFASIYNGGSTGAGVNVGVINFDGYLLSNVPLYYSAFGLPTPSGGVKSNITKVSIGGADGETQEASSEGDLDIQMVLGMAPLCNLYIYDGGKNGDPLSVYTAISSANVADVVTESYGYFAEYYGLSYFESCYDIRLQMTVQGITMMSATGDYGAPGDGTAYPQSDPEVLQVGGTTATTDSSGNRSSETAWNYNSTNGTGGGGGWDTSNLSFNVRPIYQDLSTFSIKPSINKRLFPDLSLHAAGVNSGAYYFYFNNSLSGDYVGTSFSSPVFAGQVAGMIQALSANGYLDASTFGRARLGRMQDEIYSIGSDSTVFYDVTSGNIGTLPDGTTANAGTGWDLATGWGAPDIAGLYAAYTAGALTPIDDFATSASVYSLTSPSLALGTSAQGDASNLTSVDGSTYSIQSVAQSGVGQVTAATVNVALSGDASLRKNFTLNVALSSPSLTVNYVYLLNASGAYDLVGSTVGDGTMKTLTLNYAGSTDLAKYALSDTLTVLVRATKPARLGAAPFRMSVDQVTVTERVAQSG